MKTFGAWQSVTIVAGSNDSAELDLGNNYEYLDVQLPNFTGTMGLKVAETGDTQSGSYKTLGTGVTTDDGTARADTWLIGGWQFVKFVASNAPSGTLTIRARGWR
jgi:hypothetical protein